MKFLQTVFTLLLLWALSILTVFFLKDWGPIDAVFKYTGSNAYIQAGGILAALIILILVFLYVFGKIFELIGAQRVAKALNQIPRIFMGP